MFMSEAEIPDAPVAGPRMLSGRKARAAASVFNYGNIIAILVPIPLGMLWLGLLRDRLGPRGPGVNSLVHPGPDPHTP